MCCRRIAGVIAALVAAGCGPSAPAEQSSPDARTSVDGNGCVPTSSTELACDGKDDDCNGRIDDVDVGGDGVCDCLRIALVGQAGPLPSSNFQAWLAAQGTSTLRIGLDALPLTRGVLDQFDVVILDQLSRDYTQVEADTLRDW